MKIAFAGHFQATSGSAHMIQNYYLAGRRSGIDVVVSDFGPVDATVSHHLPVISGAADADLLVLIFEGTPYVDAAKLAEIERQVPRRRRLVVDADGKYNPPRQFGGDTNHRDPSWHEQWRATFDALSDRVLQPTLDDIGVPNVRRFLYFGYPGPPPNATVPKKFDVLYVGNNWYRWHDVKALITSVRATCGEHVTIGLMGGGWTGDYLFGVKEAGRAEPGFLADNAVEVLSAPPFGEFVSALGSGRVSPIFSRPILHHMKFATPRMFESFAAETLPMFAPYLAYTRALFGDLLTPFLVTDEYGLVVNSMLGDPRRYEEAVREVRAELHAHHSYSRRLDQLLELAQ